MTWNRGKGRGIQFLRDLVGHEGEDCIIWPFTRVQNGYGVLGLNGRIVVASRTMCELAHGEPPTPEHDAAHSCGKGHEGCVNPKHLGWKTPSENSLDRRAHGTHATSQWGSAGKLQPIEIEQIRALRDSATQRQIAEQFGISDRTVRDIFRGRTHGPNRKLFGFSKDDDAIVREGYERGLPLTEIASALGRSHASIAARAGRLGLVHARYR